MHEAADATGVSSAGLPSDGADVPCSRAELLLTLNRISYCYLPPSLRSWAEMLMRVWRLSSVKTGTLGTPASLSSAEVLSHGADLHSSPSLRPDTPSYTGTAIIGLPALQEA